MIGNYFVLRTSTINIVSTDSFLVEICADKELNDTKYIRAHGRRQRGSGGGAWPAWIFIHDTDKAERGLMVLFFVLVFRCPPPLENFLPMPLSEPIIIIFIISQLKYP